MVRMDGEEGKEEEELRKRMDKKREWKFSQRRVHIGSFSTQSRSIMRGGYQNYLIKGQAEMWLKMEQEER